MFAESMFVRLFRDAFAQNKKRQAFKKFKAVESIAVSDRAKNGSITRHEIRRAVNLWTALIFQVFIFIECDGRTFKGCI